MGESTQPQPGIEAAAFVIEPSLEDRSVRIRLPEGREQTGVTLSRSELLNLITLLGQTHAALHMNEPFPQTLEGIPIPTTIGPTWYTQPVPEQNGSLIAFYHSGYGPVAAILPRFHVLQLVGLLEQQLGLMSPLRPAPTP